MNKLKDILLGATFGLLVGVFVLVTMAVIFGVGLLFGWLALLLFGIDWLAIVIGSLAVFALLGAIGAFDN